MIEIIEHKGHTIRIVEDIDPQSSRDFCNLGTMVCFHKKYHLGDGGHGLTPSDFEGWADLEDYLRRREDAAVVLPLYLYEHGGITMRTTPFGCRFDSGQVGFIYVAKSTLLVEHGSVDEERARAVLEAEVEAYDDYLTGSVYGFQIEGPDCDDSCYGFFGRSGLKSAIEDAKGAIDAALSRKEAA